MVVKGEGRVKSSQMCDINYGQSQMKKKSAMCLQLYLILIFFRDLNLKKPIFQKTSSYGHFGREDPDFNWEKPKTLTF